jgi:hypothetical protein
MIKLIILFGLILLIYKLYTMYVSEKFKDNCDPDNCGRFSPLGCSKCSSCGYCVGKNGTGHCVAGNADGPYDSRHCSKWIYRNYPIFPDYDKLNNLNFVNYGSVYWQSEFAPYHSLYNDPFYGKKNADGYF